MKWTLVPVSLFAIVSCTSLQTVPSDAHLVAECMVSVLQSIPNTQSVRVMRAKRSSDAVLMIDYSFLGQGTRHRNRIGLNHDLYEGKDHWFFWANQLTSLDEDPGYKVMTPFWEMCRVDTGVIA